MRGVGQRKSCTVSMEMPAVHALGGIASVCTQSSDGFEPGYWTVRVKVVEAVVLPEAPVTVMV